jgi:hypothetical protein
VEHSFLKATARLPARVEENKNRLYYLLKSTFITQAAGSFSRRLLHAKYQLSNSPTLNSLPDQPFNRPL